MKRSKDTATGDVREAYVVVMKDVMWQITRETHQFIYEMLSMEDKVFTDDDIKAEIAKLMSRFPPQA